MLNHGQTASVTKRDNLELSFSRVNGNGMRCKPPNTFRIQGWIQ
jgi:hypothetical protein